MGGGERKLWVMVWECRDKIVGFGEEIREDVVGAVIVTEWHLVKVGEDDWCVIGICFSECGKKCCDVCEEGAI